MTRINHNRPRLIVDLSPALIAFFRCLATLAVVLIAFALVLGGESVIGIGFFAVAAIGFIWGIGAKENPVTAVEWRENLQWHDTQLAEKEERVRKGAR